MIHIFKFLTVAMAIAMAMIGLHPSSAQGAEGPVITFIDVRGSNVIVRIDVPPGIKKVTLEGRQNLSSKSWEPKAVRYLEGAGETLSIEIARNAGSELLRVRAEESLALPASFFTGQNQFISGTNRSSTPLAPGTQNLGTLETVPGATDDRSIAAPNREVVESDIWKVAGDRVYFFNQYRGLQVLDISNPDKASVLGTMEMANSSQQMYLFRGTNVLLLTRGECSMEYVQSGDEDIIWVVDVAKDTPTPLASIPVKGDILESRLVGDVLYLASTFYRPDGTNFYTYIGSDGKTITNSWVNWVQATYITSIDFADAAHPTLRSSLTLPGYTATITATDTYLFVAENKTATGNGTILHCYDITDPEGTITEYATVNVPGQIPDKFKIQWVDGILSVISEVWEEGTQVWQGGTHTRLINYRLPDPRSAGPAGVTKLGEVTLGKGERLFATRFDGNKVYVVTFLRIDPLWIVDNSDPAKPVISGELEVPGWSTYIYPMNDRLLTLGVETTNGWQVSVSLFDVANPAKPSLLSRVNLGQNGSYSEANHDEKALTILPEAGLVLVPFESWSGQSQHGVQLIDLGRDSLTRRGVIDDNTQIRRATLTKDRVVTVSGTKFLSVDISNRDLPQVKHSVNLAWAVDKVLLAGEFLLQISKGNYWGNDLSTRVLISPAAQPGLILNEVTITNGPFLGVSYRNHKLYLAQGQGAAVEYQYLHETNGTKVVYHWDKYVIKTNPGSLNLSVFDASNLPALPLVGQTTAPIQNSFYGELAGHWPTPETLVLTVSHSQNYWMYDYFPNRSFEGASVNFTPGAMVDLSSTLFRGGSYPWFWRPWAGSNPLFFTFDVENPQPVWKSEFVLNNSTNATEFFNSEMRAENGKIYLSHLDSVPFRSITNIYVYTNFYAMGGDNSKPTTIFVQTNSYVYYEYLQYYYLDVVDFNDPQFPTAFKPVSIPGRMIGLTHNGAVIQTLRNDSTNSLLEALAYDGTSAFPLDSATLPSSWISATTQHKDTLFLFTSWDTNNTFEAWTLDATLKKQTKLGAYPIDYNPGQLINRDGLIGFASNSLHLFDGNKPENLNPLLKVPFSYCLGLNLQESDGAINRGLWIPRNSYSVLVYPIAQP